MKIGSFQEAIKHCPHPDDSRELDVIAYMKANSIKVLEYPTKVIWSQDKIVDTEIPPSGPMGPG